MTDYTLTSAKNLPDKAQYTLELQARRDGYTQIGDLAYQLVDDPTGRGRIHQFTLTAS